MNEGQVRLNKVITERLRDFLIGPGNENLQTPTGVKQETKKKKTEKKKENQDTR